MGNTWVVIDLDGTREAARQRALPKGDDLPPAFRRLDARLWLLATPAANVGRLSEHVQRLLRPIATSGSAVLAIVGMDGIGRSYAKVLQLFAGTWLHLSFLKNAPCCGSMANMALGRCSPMWRAWRL